MLTVQEIHGFSQGRGHGRLWKARTSRVGSLVRGRPAGRKGKRAEGPGAAGGQEGTEQAGDLQAEALGEQGVPREGLTCLSRPPATTPSGHRARLGKAWAQGHHPRGPT